MNLKEMNINQSQDLLISAFSFFALINCKDECVSVRCMFFFSFNRAVFLMTSTINIIIKRDNLLLILNVLFNYCL